MFVFVYCVRDTILDYKQALITGGNTLPVAKLFGCSILMTLNFQYNHCYVDQKILSQVDSLRRQNLSLEYRNSQLQEVSRFMLKNLLQFPHASLRMVTIIIIWQFLLIVIHP